MKGLSDKGLCKAYGGEGDGAQGIWCGATTSMLHAIVETLELLERAAFGDPENVQ
jgi:hypothetical protein